MNQTEFVGSLTPEQTIAFFDILNSQRDRLKAMYDSAESGLVVAQAGITANLTTEKTALQDRLGKSEIDKTESDTTAKATHAEAVRVLNENNLIVVTALNTEITQLKADLASTNTAVASLTERLSRLLVELPFNPRLISTPAFIARISDMMFLFAKVAAGDSVAYGFLESLFLKEASKESIKLDSPKLAYALNYLVEKEWLKPERTKDITRDCTRDEAYKYLDATDIVATF